MIVVIDYGMGNLRSILKAYERLGIEAKYSSRIEDIMQAKKLVLPGVGHFAGGMSQLRKMGFIEVLHKKVVAEKTPILGICLGMQLFTARSEEGDVEGLGWIDAQTIKFKQEKKQSIKIPHVGWNSIIVEKDCPIFHEVDTKELFYFVHSYHVKCKDAANVISKTEYGVAFVSSVQKDNILGVQFHPEKSHKNGLQILKNFSDLI